LDHKTHHGPDSGEATTFPHIVFSVPHFGDYIQMALFPGTPKLESWNCPEIVLGGVPGLWALITLDFQVWSRRGLNQTCITRRDLSNAMSHSPFGGREEVDSRLLVIGSQIVSLTPGPSFAHNLGDRCPNGQCKAIFDIYAWRPFQWHQEHLNSRWFGPCCRTLNIRESWRTPSPQLWECWDSPLHLAKVGLRQMMLVCMTTYAINNGASKHFLAKVMKLKLIELMIIEYVIVIDFKLFKNSIITRFFTIVDEREWCTPKLLERFKCEFEGENIRKRRSWGMFPNS